MIFSKRNCNYPQPKYAMWWLTQFRRWGMVEGAPDYEGVAKQVMRPDIYEEAMKEIGVAHGGRTTSPRRCSTASRSIPKEPEEVRDGFVHSPSAEEVDATMNAETIRTGDVVEHCRCCRCSGAVASSSAVGDRQRHVGHEPAVARRRPGR